MRRRTLSAWLIGVVVGAVVLIAATALATYSALVVSKRSNGATDWQLIEELRRRQEEEEEEEDEDGGGVDAGKE